MASKLVSVDKSGQTLTAVDMVTLELLGVRVLTKTYGTIELFLQSLDSALSHNYRLRNLEH